MCKMEKENERRGLVTILLKENQTATFPRNPPHLSDAANGQYPQDEDREESTDSHGKLYSVRPYYRF